MRTRHHLRLLSLVGALGLLQGAASSCASEREVISRVQPNALPKAMFVRANAQGAWLDDSDAWYFRATVVDAPAANSVPAYIGTAGDMYRVKWKIEERWLLAINEYPDVEGAGDKRGGVVAAFAIQSHFDVQRSYNPNTGEETNVVVENTTDRPWWARTHMRVDWSTNKVSEAGFTFPAYESVSAATYFVQDPKHPDAPVFSPDYLDVTANYVVKPTPSTCFYLHRASNCAPGSVSARLSFMKVPEREYLPRDYPDRLPVVDDKGATLRTVSGTPIGVPMQDQFGFFRVQRARYDERMGTLEKRYVYRAAIWNIWQQWFQHDAKGNVLFEDGTALPWRQAKAVIDDGSKTPKLLPYAQRKVRPIVFHVNQSWPTELLPMALETGKQWNDVYQETVASARVLEKKAGAAATMAEVRAEVDAMKARNENVFVVCPNNPVKAGDDAACGPAGTVARLGDQRYSFLYWVDKPQPTGPLGLGPSYSDPWTGELFSAGAHIYGAALDTAAQRGLEVVNLLSGRNKASDYIEGVATDLYAKRLKNGEVPGPSSPFQMPGEAGFDLTTTTARLDKTLDRGALASIAKNGLPVASGPSGHDRIRMIKGTPLERAVLDNPEMRALMGKPRDQALSDDELGKVSELLFSSDLRKEEDERARVLGEHGCFYPVEFTDDASVGIAKYLVDKYGKGSTPLEDETIQRKMWQEIRHLYGLQVTLHEVGHTLGLAHNFEGSADPINFFDEYWKLAGDKPKYGAPLTEAQKNGRMVEYQYSTVMDYTSRWNSEIHGLGKYDYASIRMAYGDVVETWPAGKIVDPLYKIDPTKFTANLGFQGYSAELLDGINRSYRHYTQIPGEFSDGTGSLMKAGRELRRFGDVHAAAQDHYRRVPADKRNGVKTGSWEPTSANAKVYGTEGSIDVVPYRWCGDQFAGSVGRPMCERWDTGVDGFEVVRDAIERYRQYYVFYAFTNGRVDGFSKLRGYLSSVSSRYFSHVHRHYIHWLFNGVYGSRPYYWANVLDRAGDGVAKGYIGDPDWYKDPGGGLPASLAVQWGLDRLVDVLGTPDVGVYKANDAGSFTQTHASVFGCSVDGNPARCANDSNTVTLGLEDGARYRYTAYDTSSGYYGFDRVKSVGSFYDKMAALLTLTDSNANFVGQDTTNATSYRIGFYLVYPRALSSVFGGIATDRLANYAWHYELDPATKAPKLSSADLFQAIGRADGADVDPTKRAGKPIDSSWHLYYKAYALLFSMAEFQANYSQSWNDAIRVWCVGCGEAFEPGPSVVTVRFTNPLSGKQYAAIRYGDGRFSPGAELIEAGQRLSADYATALAAPDSADKAAKVATATSALQEHVKLLDLVRSLYGLYGYARF